MGTSIMQVRMRWPQHRLLCNTRMGPAHVEFELHPLPTGCTKNKNHTEQVKSNTTLLQWTQIHLNVTDGDDSICFFLSPSRQGKDRALRKREATRKCSSCSLLAMSLMKLVVTSLGKAAGILTLAVVVLALVLNYFDDSVSDKYSR